MFIQQISSQLKFQDGYVIHSFIYLLNEYIGLDIF